MRRVVLNTFLLTALSVTLAANWLFRPDAARTY